jgi:pimeloyl-ACP methyl ester carboxylesterase
MAASGSSSWLRRAAGVAVVSMGAVAALTMLLATTQERLIYLPRRYGRAYLEEADAATSSLGLQRVHYRTSQGDQVAWYVPPMDARGPDGASRLWLFFGGNAATALDWLMLLEPASRRSGALRASGAAMLLVDYPGYGLCEGAPTPAALLENAQAAYRALVSLNLGATRATPVGLVGQSIGAAAAMQFAAAAATGNADTTIDRLLLISPFTSLREVAQRVVGSVPGLGLLLQRAFVMNTLLRHNYDNEAMLARFTEGVAARAAAARPRLTIMHGGADSLIPFAMGRRLADLADRKLLDVRMRQYGAADHNDIFRFAADHFIEVLADKD